MSLLRLIATQFGLSNTPANNFTLDASADNGTLKLARGNSGETTQDILTVDASGVVCATQGIRGGVVNRAAQNTTSGTAFNFTDIPSWVKRVTVMLKDVSLSGTSSHIYIRLGTGVTPATTGYAAGEAYVRTDMDSSLGLQTVVGFPVQVGAAGYAMSGAMTFTHVGGNAWVGSGAFNNPNVAPYVCAVAGNVQLPGALGMVRIESSNGTDTFDSGLINILYEG